MPNSLLGCKKPPVHVHNGLDTAPKEAELSLAIPLQQDCTVLSLSFKCVNTATLQKRQTLRLSQEFVRTSLYA